MLERDARTVHLALPRCAAQLVGQLVTLGQSLFEAAFRADVAEIDKSLEKMIVRVMARFAELTGRARTFGW